MKKIKGLLAALVLVGLTVTSCGSDDSGPAATITGKWNLSKTVSKVGDATNTENYAGNEAGCDKDYYEFVGANSGALRDVIFFKNAEEVCTEDEAEAASWNKSEDLLTVTGGDLEGAYEITKLSNSELIILSEGSLGGTETSVTYYFKKAAN